MSTVLTHKHRTIVSTDTLISFETEAGGAWPKWWRWLMVKGKKAYLLGNICDTCDFHFERHAGATTRPEVEAMKIALGGGMTDLSPSTVQTLEAIIPSGEYQVLLLKSLVQPVQLGTNSDYFAHEQIKNSGVDGFWGLPHHPKVPYYRTGTLQLGEKEYLFEFLIPMFPKNWLKQDRIEYYKNRLSQDDCPTAVAVSVLDVKTPAHAWSSVGHQYEGAHYCLAQYLLDGHHKAAAAAETGKPITIISFLAVTQGVSTPEQIETVLSALYKS